MNAVRFMVIRFIIEPVLRLAMHHIFRKDKRLIDFYFGYMTGYVLTDVYTEKLVGFLERLFG